jgi:hypothetical protein
MKKILHLLLQLPGGIILRLNVTGDAGPSANLLDIDDPIFALHPVIKRSPLVRG